MAVPESSPPVRVIQNNMRMLAQTVVQGDGIHRAVSGRFRHPNTSDVLLAKETSLVLASASNEGELTVHHQQPVHGTILDIQILHAQQQASPPQVPQTRKLCCTSVSVSAEH